MIPVKIVHLLSGGLDSVTMLYDLHGRGEKVHCLLFDYHQQHVQELQFAKAHCHKLGLLFSTIELPTLRGSMLTDGTGSWVVPFRNPIMLSLAVNLAVEMGVDTVTLGANADDAADFPDCRWEVVDAMNHAVKLSGFNVEICAPYLHKHKWEIAAIAREIGVDTSLIWSCYRGGVKPCGECPACVKLKEALV